MRVFVAPQVRTQWRSSLVWFDDASSYSFPDLAISVSVFDIVMRLIHISSFFSFHTLIILLLLPTAHHYMPAGSLATSTSLFRKLVSLFGKVTYFLQLYYACGSLRFIIHA
jgi:hypothetical protein